MAWIKTIDYENSDGKLRSLYDRVRGPDDYIDNILKVHSLRPHTLEGHMKLYKNVLHHSHNSIPKWFLEALGVYVSMLNGCTYCVEHHYQGMERLVGDEARAEKIRTALENGKPENVFHDRELALMRYAETLTKSPSAISQTVIEELRRSGLDDGEILEANQVISYFNYANRTVTGLGVNLAGDIPGLSPGDSDDPDNWSHA